MNDGILDSVKCMLNIETGDHAFDNELIMHINAAIAELVQGGVGPDAGLRINAETSWTEFSSDVNIVSDSLEYVYCKTRLIWDPPANSFVCDAFSKRAEESYWRAYITGNELRRETAT